MFLLLLATLVVGAQAPDQEWAVSTSRMLGAAGTVRDRAWRLRTTAEAAAQTGRASSLSAVVADAQELERAVISAALAAESLQKLQPTEAQ